MIAVISDLHLEEEASDIIPGHGSHRDLTFRRNLDPRAYRHFIAGLADEAEQRKVRDFHLVIAGDLFDFSRTTLWFRDKLRPYVELRKIDSALEAKTLAILEAIARERSVKEALESIQLLSRGKYVTNEDRGSKIRDFPVKNVVVDYLPGNHDRLSNATPAVRRRVRELLGMKGDKKFPHYFFFKDPEVLVRHGHEYDSNNFGVNLEKAKKIPLELPDAAYDAPTFGDFITIDVAVRMPYLFRRKYGDRQILEDQVMRNLYERLLQFDDVRPQSALFDYLLDDSAGDYSSEEAWERLVPVIQDILDEIHDQKFFRECLRRQAEPWAPSELEAARGLLKLGGWRNRLAREAARKISNFMMGGDMPQPQLVAQNEELLQKKKVRLIIAGHTHHPEVCLVGSDPASDRFYINTGTWRTRIPSTPDKRTFGRIKELTYVMLFTEAEEQKRGKSTLGRFDYWNGYTRSFSDDAGRR
jgi:UDP-2,3-diacylglucosamine pyrophosphatase LpxH